MAEDPNASLFSFPITANLGNSIRTWAPFLRRMAARGSFVGELFRFEEYPIEWTAQLMTIAVNGDKFGRYIRIGDLCLVYGYQEAIFGGLMVNSVEATLPFPAANKDGITGVATISDSVATARSGVLTIAPQSNIASIYLYNSAAYTAGQTNVRFWTFYEIAQQATR